MAQLVRAPVSYVRMNFLWECNPEIASSILAADIVNLILFFCFTCNGTAAAKSTEDAFAGSLHWRDKVPVVGPMQDPT